MDAPSVAPGELRVRLSLKGTSPSRRPLSVSRRRDACIEIELGDNKAPASSAEVVEPSSSGRIRRPSARSPSSSSSSSPSYSSSSTLHLPISLSAASTPTAKPQLKRHRMSRKDLLALLQDPLSDLTGISLRDVVNWNVVEQSFSSDERRALFSLLPPVDQAIASTDEPDTGHVAEALARSLKGNVRLAHAIAEFPRRIEKGLYDPDTMAVRKMRSDKMRRRMRDPWKEEQYEDYYGQRLGLAPVEQALLHNQLKMPSAAKVTDEIVAERSKPRPRKRVQDDAPNSIEKAATSPSLSETAARRRLVSEALAKPARRRFDDHSYTARSVCQPDYWAQLFN